MIIWYLLGANIFFVLIAIYFSFRYERKTDETTRQKREIERRVFELSLLQSITDKIGYSLNIENIAETIAVTVENLFDLSTVSYAIREGNTIRLKTITKEPVAAPYLADLTKIICDGMASIDSNLSNRIVVQNIVTAAPEGNKDHSFDKVISQKALEAAPQSYFNIPMVLDNKLAGMINISSARKVEYHNDDIVLLVKIVETAQNTIQRLKQVIKTEESKLDSLILSLPQGAIMFTIEKYETPQGLGSRFKTSVINQAAKDFLRLGELTSIEEVLTRFPQDVMMGNAIEGVFTSKQPATIKDVKIFDRDFEIYINPVFVPGTDALIGVALNMRDISPEKKLERVRADFTDMMMHELRAPLTAIRGAAALLTANTLPKEDSDKMPRIILDSSNDMLSTVSDFLDAAKIDEGKFALNKSLGDVIKVISEHVEIFTYAAREKNITINLDKNNTVGEFLFDQIRIGQVINNLLSNSIKFTNVGGKIDLKIEPKEGEIEITVTDNGIGVPDNKKAVLFTKFGQIEGNPEQLRSANHTGGATGSGSSGLGLFICHKIIDAHGGKIWLESTEGLGTKAHFTLPTITEDVKSESQASHPSNLSN